MADRNDWNRQTIEKFRANGGKVGGIWEGQRDDRLRIGTGSSRVGAGVHPSLVPPGEAIHQAGGGAVGRRRFGLLERVRARDADGGESEGFGPALDVCRESHLPLA